mmetsp:Transcript_10011/g.29522  ORF Transcript_10011/g.29522 Transcript_10011/m.29522 type:complete len:316 (+) Transcript_10011:5363-6310(+)
MRRNDVASSLSHLRIVFRAIRARAGIVASAHAAPRHAAAVHDEAHRLLHHLRVIDVQAERRRVACVVRRHCVARRHVFAHRRPRPLGSLLGSALGRAPPVGSTAATAAAAATTGLLALPAACFRRGRACAAPSPRRGRRVALGRRFRRAARLSFLREHLHVIPRLVGTLGFVAVRDGSLCLRCPRLGQGAQGRNNCDSGGDGQARSFQNSVGHHASELGERRERAGLASGLQVLERRLHEPLREAQRRGRYGGRPRQRHWGVHFYGRPRVHSQDTRRGGRRAHATRLHETRRREGALHKARRRWGARRHGRRTRR